MTNQNNAAKAAEQDPLSDEYVNAVIREHGYGHPAAVAARLWQWIGLHGGENGVTLLIYEAHKALSKLRAEGVQAGDERRATDSCGYVAVKASAIDWLKKHYPALTIKAGLCERYAGRLYTLTRLMSDHDAAMASAPAPQARNADGILRERMKPISDALGVDAICASVHRGGIIISTFDGGSLVYIIGVDGTAIKRVALNNWHAPTTLTADQVKAISQAASEIQSAPPPASAPVVGESLVRPQRVLTDDKRAAVEFYSLNPSAAVRDLDKRLAGHAAPQAMRPTGRR